MYNLEVGTSEKSVLGKKGEEGSSNIERYDRGQDEETRCWWLAEGEVETTDGAFIGYPGLRMESKYLSEAASFPVAYPCSSPLQSAGGPP